MVHCDKSPVAPISLAKEKAKGNNGSYREPDVAAQLKSDFHDKCYICELQGLQDPQIEHLVPHMGNVDLRFDWNNLFWSCSHCNSVKNQRKYDGKIINCCKDDPEEHISFVFTDNQVNITPLDALESSVVTAELVDEVFNLKNTGMRVIAADHRMKALQKEMNIFFNELERYEQHKSGMNKRRVAVRLSRSSAFAAFKRSYIRDRAEYGELQEYAKE